MSTDIAENLLLFSPEFTEYKEYWTKKLAGDIVETKLLPYNKKECLSQDDGEVIEIRFPDSLNNRILKVGKDSDLSVYIILLTGLKILIYRYTGNEDITVTSPLYKPEISGHTLNNRLLIRDDIDGNMTFKKLLLKVRQSTLEAYKNQDYPFDKLLEFLFEPDRVKHNNFISPVLCSMENIHETGIVDRGYPFTFSFVRDEEQVIGRIGYYPGVHDKHYAGYMAKHFITLLSHSIEDVDRKISEISFLTEEEKEQLVIHFNKTAAGYPADKTVHQVFSERAAKTPDNIAAVGAARRTIPGKNSESITYRHLNEKSNQLARELRDRGLRADAIAGIMLERSIEVTVAIFAILKAGGAYMPIDPDYPEARKKNLLEDSGARVLLTQSLVFAENKNVLHRIERENVLFLDDRTLYSGPADNPENINGPGDMAYLLYTSGTTGKPKGAMILHRGVNNLAAGLEERIYKQYKPDGPLNVALLSPLIFDASVKQVFGALLLGHNLCIVPEDVRIDASQLLEFYKERQIDISDGIPTHISMLTEVMPGGASQFPVKHFIIGGEPLTGKVAERFFHQFKSGVPKITNVYGPTECCVDTTSYEITGEDAPLPDQIPIGKPMPNYRVYILGGGCRLRPAGVAGELCIGGAGVARGYLKRPRLTEEKFNPDPFEHFFIGENKPAGKIYHTGDLARWLPDGNIEFLGRIDQQVKIRGIRIELEEIESQLLNHEKIKEAVVAAKKSKSGDKYICAYTVSINDKSSSDSGAGGKIKNRKELCFNDIKLKDTAGENPDRTLVENFEEKVLTHGDDTAVEAEGKGLTYSALNRWANRLARVITETYDDRWQLSKPERVRYTRQLLLDGWGIEAQEKLKRSRISVFGAGGIGSPIIYQLALMGVGTIVICDYDDVELSNLNRQFLHDDSRIGMNKALSAKMTVKRINPHVTVVPYTEKVTGENIYEIVGDSDVIFDCVDDLETKFILSRCAVRKQIPHILSAMIEISAYAAILHAPHTPCFHCLHDRRKADEISELRTVVENYRKNPFPVASPALFVTTGFVCNEVAKILLAMENPAYNRFFLFNQIGSRRIVETTGYRQMTFPFSEHFRKICKAQGFDWDECWRGNFVEELRIEPDPHCTVCGDKSSLEDVSTPGVNFTQSETALPMMSKDPQVDNNSNGIRQLQTVAALVGNDVDISAGMLGVLKAGKTYLPLHPTADPETMTEILTDSEARLIITGNDYFDLAVELRDRVNKRIPVVNVNEIEADETLPAENLNIPINPDRAAYISYAADSTDGPTEDQLRDYLARELPDYMIPMYFVPLQKMPLTPGGKVDINELPQPEIVKTGSNFAPPRDKVEKKMAEIWAGVLELEKNTIGLGANFFELGGHSLKATILAARIHKAFDVKLSLALIFKNPVMSEMAAYIKEKAVENRYTSIKPVEKKEYYPLSSAQKRLFTLEQIQGKEKFVGYNIPRFHIFEGKLDRELFAKVFNEIGNRNEALRTTFHLVDGEPVQKITAAFEFDVTYDKCSEAEVDERIKEFRGPFEIERLPLFRVGLLQVEEEKHFVLFNIHHLISDGISMDLLVGQFVLYYEGKSIEPLRIQYKDYAEWQDKLLKGEEFERTEKYWLEKMADFVFTRVPPDKFGSNRPIEEERRGLVIDKPLYKKIETFSNRHGITRFTFMITVFMIALAREMDHNDITIGTPFANRDHYDLKNLIGIFLNFLLIRSKIDKNDTFLNNLLNVKETVFDALDNHYYPYELLNFKIKQNTHFKSEELYTIMFNYVPKEKAKETGTETLARQFKISRYNPGKSVPKCDINLFVLDANESITLNLIYISNYYSDYRIERILKNYLNIIESALENENIMLSDIKPVDEVKSDDFESEFEKYYENDDLFFEAEDV